MSREIVSLDSLESRRLMAVTVSLVSGKLSILGTAAADTIAVNQVGTSIKVVSGTATSSYLASAVTSIAADLLAGNDKLTIATTITKPTSLIGGAGNDTIIGGNGKDVLRGVDGNDSLVGNADDDLLDGNIGTDVLLGGVGNDTFTSGLGSDTVNGGDGADTIDYSARKTSVNIAIDFNATIGTVSNGENGENDHLSNIELGIGGSGNDTLVFFDSYSQANGLVSDVKLLGGPGNDEILVLSDFTNRSRNVSLYGGIGNDTLGSGQSDDNIYLFGNDGNDEVRTFDGISQDHDTTEWKLPKGIDGGGGIDLWKLTHYDSSYDQGIAYGSTPVAYNVMATIENVLAYSDSPIKISGNNSDNHITIASQSGSTVLGGVGNDTLDVDNSSNAGPVTLNGGDGNDIITGGKFNDSLDGQAGNDLIHGGLKDDIIIGGLGLDSLYGDDGNDTIYSKDSISEIVNGGAGTDKANTDVIDLRSGIEVLI